MQDSYDFFLNFLQECYTYAFICNSHQRARFSFPREYGYISRMSPCAIRMPLVLSLLHLFQLLSAVLCCFGLKVFWFHLLIPFAAPEDV